MLYNLIFIAVIVAFITIKLKDISLRQKLDQNKERRLLLSGGLVILFLLSTITFPFPESLYWFIVLGLLFTVSLVSLDIIKLEWRRMMKLNTKDKIINVLFYSLFAIVINLFI